MHLKEEPFLFGRHSRILDASAQPNDARISSLIDPATGEKKEKIERNCIAYLQDPSRTTVGDFLNFTSNMIELIGGKRYKEKNEVVFTSSNPLLDQETNTSTVLTVKISTLLGRELTEVGIKDELGELYVGFSTRRYFFLPTMPINFRGTLVRNELTSTEVKGFAKRVFYVYLQGQQTQPPTPQS